MHPRRRRRGRTLFGWTASPRRSTWKKAPGPESRTRRIEKRTPEYQLVQRTTQVVVTVQLRGEREHGVAVVAGQGRVHVRQDLGRGPRVVDAGVPGVEQRRHRGPQQDLRPT